MTSLLLVPLDDIVVFPNMTVTLPVDVGDEERVLLVPVHDGEYAKVGTVAEVTDTVRLPGGARAAQPRAASTAASPARRTPTPPAACASRSRNAPTRSRPGSRRASSSASIARSSRRSSSCAATTAASRPSCARSSSPASLADTIGYAPDFSFDQKVELLETLDVVERLTLALELQRERLAELQVRKRIRDDVEEGAAKQQREYVLRKQMESIRKELGEDDGSVGRGLPREDRGGRDAGGRPRAGRARARAASSGWATRPASPR